MKHNVRILPNTFLYFTHDYRFEHSITPSNVYYDGGYVEYTIDNGKTWKKLNSISSGQTYNASVTAGNPRANRSPMFGGFTHNASGNVFSTTSFDLSALSGKNARFRWVIASDSAGGSAGWRIDGISLQTCVNVVGNVTLNSELTPAATHPLNRGRLSTVQRRIPQPVVRAVSSRPARSASAAG